MSNSDPDKADAPKPIVKDPPAQIVPVAAIETIQPIPGASYMWVVAAACLLIAIGLVWWSLPETGYRITVHFPDGHGLEAEDSVRFRGIDVGMVRRVELNRELTGVDVTIELKPSAEPMAREGTRFWIVRPELSLTGITGIETAVGHKYIGLIPGDPQGPRQTVFEGLALSPPDALPESGIEILLRGDLKYSVNRDSPVTCRGVEIGRVLSVGLSQDARYVDARARIFHKHTPLVTDKTVFWANSGVDMEFSISSGLSLSAESLETIARGGISMLTIENGGKQINPGHVFVLHSSAEKEWMEMAKKVRSNDIELYGSLPMSASWKKKTLLGTGVRYEAFNGIPIQMANGQTGVLVPSDVIIAPSEAVTDTYRIGVSGQAGKEINPEQSTVPFADERLVLLSFPGTGNFPWLKPTAVIRDAEELEDCLAVRGTWQSPDNLTFVHYPIEKQELSDQWQINSFHGDREIWHGSPVLSALDGKLVGILLVEKNRADIVRFQLKQFE